MTDQWLNTFCLSSLASKRIYQPLFASCHKRRRVTKGKRHACCCDGLGGSALQIIRLDWLLEHVQVPAAQLAVGRDSYEIVGILGAHDVNTKDRVGVGFGYSKS